MSKQCFGLIRTLPALLLMSGLANAQPVPTTARIIPLRWDAHVRWLASPVTLSALRVQATATDAFTVSITWMGPVNKSYTVREIGGAYQHTGTVPPFALSREGEPFYGHFHIATKGS